MASFPTRTLIQRRILLIRNLNTIYSLTFSAQCSLRHASVTSHGKCCISWLTKRNYRDTYILSKVVPLKLLQLARCESTAAKPPNEKPRKFQQFKKILHEFFVGAKELYTDVRKTLKIRRKLKMNDWHYSVLFRHELWTMVKVFKSFRNRRRNLFDASVFLLLVGKMP